VRKTTALRLVPAGIALAAFLVLALLTDAGFLRSFDERLLFALRDSPRGWLEIVFRDVTALGGYTLLTLFTLAMCGFLWLNAKRAAALLVLVSSAGAMAIANVLKAIFERPRPDLVTHLVEVSSASFPSGHAMLSATVYLTLGALGAQVLAPLHLRIYPLLVAIAFTLLVGVSRVYLGVHWPTDVLAGWCAGAAWAFLCSAVAETLQRRGVVEAEDPRP
jgi:undecaprenyl-diphosphatase